ncbi:MAG: type II secretion system secretin GspD [Methylotenera sp.]|nr:type II secretion system secretin GspD [Oligoflexia bacterium]
MIQTNEKSMTANEMKMETQMLPLVWVRILAGISSLIGIAGLIAIMTHNGWAADTGRKGFESGPKTFSNPYATGDKPFFDEEEDADFGAPEEDGGFTGTAPSNGGDSTGGAPRVGGGRGNPGRGGISVGGNANGGIKESAKAPSPLHVDNESAEGSKEIITDFNFPDADILDIAKALGKLTGKNFILDKDVKGRITIISNSPVTVSDAWKAFLTALDMNGFALIPSGKFTRIARQRDARDKQLKTYTGDYSPDTDALITRLFPLKYLSAEEVARNFRSFMPANSRIIPYEQTNTVIVTDTGSNIAKLNKLLEILDVEGYDAGIEVIPVKYASAVELSKLIDTLIPGTNTGGSPGAPRFSSGGSKFTARRTKEGGIINTIIADERTNNLIVHANTKGADQIRELLSKLDKKSAPTSSAGGKVHVIYLQFADSEQIGATLNNLSQAAAGGRPATGGAGGGGTGVNPVQSSLFEGNIKIAPDKATNSLVVTASPADFVTIQRVINKLDIPRDQVFAEVVIMEVTLGKDFNYSTNVINPSNGIGFTPNTDLFDFIANPLGSKGATFGFKAGSERTVTVGGQSVKVSGVQGLIKAIQTNSNANVLATPQILTLDNTEATFETAELIPLQTSTAVQGAGVSTSISKERVSLSITIKPQINKMSNFVKLDINTKLADISKRELPAQVASQAFATVERNAKTSLIVADQDTVVLGGLMRDNTQESVSKIPVLGDIPLLGWLFRAKSSSATKTNLLMFITPRIIRQYESIRAVLDKKLKERDDFLEANTGGNDPIRSYRDKIIKDLPSIQKIINTKPQNIHTIDNGQFNSEVDSEDGETKNSDKAPTVSRETRSGNTANNTASNVMNPGNPAAPLNPGAAQPPNSAPFGNSQPQDNAFEPIPEVPMAPPGQ